MQNHLVRVSHRLTRTCGSRRWLVTCLLVVAPQLWPHPADCSTPEAQTRAALETRDSRPPARMLPGWPYPSLPAERVLPGAESMAMLPAEQHMGEFSEGDLAFIRHAAVSQEAQVIYAKLALRRAKGVQVRNVAQRLAAFNRKARTDLASVVQPYGIVLPSGIDSAHQWLRAHLTEIDAKSFDRMYVRSQIEEHESAVRAFREQVNHGKSNGLRAWARGILSSMEEHRRILESLDAAKPVS